MNITTTRRHFLVLLSATLLLLFAAALPFTAHAQIQLEVPIGTTSVISDDGSGIGEYITAMYQFIVGTIGILATVVIMYAGVLWAGAAGNSSIVKKAQEYIIGAIMGLAIALGSYLILFNINPFLVILPAIEIEEIDIPFTQDGNPSQCNSSTQACLGAFYTYIFEQDQQGLESHLVTINVSDGTGNSGRLRVHEDARSAFEGAFNSIRSTNQGLAPSKKYAINFGDTGTYNWRANVNNPSCLSNHSFGFAIDVNWSRNPNCPKGSSCYTSSKPSSDICATINSELGVAACDLPDFVIQAFTSNGFRWGGHYNSLKDYMHFEWMGHGCG